MKGSQLGRDEIKALLDALSERLGARGAFAKLHLIGGACLALAYERDRTTMDIDARIDAGENELKEAIREVSTAHGLDPHWLDERARGVVPETDETAQPTLYESEHLIVTGAGGSELLAMKLEASRDKDLEDIEYLIDHLGIDTSDAALAVHCALFPNSRKTPQARAALAAIAQDKEGLEGPTPIETLREQWRAALAPERFPRYEFEEHDGRFTLTVQDTPESQPETLGRNLSLYAMALRERIHRRWPVDSQDMIIDFVEAERARTRRHDR